MRAPPRRPLQRHHDVVIVGSGSGGAVVARRLIERTSATVLVIEAGGAGLGDPAIETPAAWVPLARTPYDWGHVYAPGPAIDGRRVPIPRGKVLGGCSATNAMLWYRGHAADYDAWVEAGAAGWSFAECLPAFRRCETWQGGASAWRGGDGPLTITTSPEPHPLAVAMIEGARELGLPVTDDPNGAANEGATFSNFNIVDGKRQSVAVAYLEPMFAQERLTILTGSRAIGMVIEAGRAVGVRHLVDGEVIETRGDRVVLAAGAIETPRLMMLSGLGPAAELRRLMLPVLADLPGVGQNLQDHPLIRALNFRAKRPLGPPRDNGGGSMINWRSTAAAPRADVHAIPIQNRSATTELGEAFDLAGDVFAIAPGLMRSKSVGYMRLLTAAPEGALEIQPNFLAEPEDLAATLAAVETMLDLVHTRAFADLFAGHLAPAKLGDRAALSAFVRQACSTFFHVCGTCRMGADAGAVTDARLAVRGIEGLMIADASVMPIIPTCNTHAPTVMIGERAADFLAGVSA